jgi:hypothetical protein
MDHDHALFAPKLFSQDQTFTKMGKFEFSNLPEATHHCTSHRDGDWVIWRCPHCQGYERRLHLRTGEMRINRGHSTAQHTGANTGATNMEALLKAHHLN